MAIDTTCCSCDVTSSFDNDNININVVGSEMEERERKGRIHIKSHQRQQVRSYLEDFQQEQSHAMRLGLLSSKESQSQGQMMVRKAVGMDDDAFENEDDAEVGGGGEGEEEDHPFYTPAQNRSILTRFGKQPRREGTARRRKRFPPPDLPAIGLQTIITARTSIEMKKQW